MCLKRLWILFVLISGHAFAADFGDIPANLALPASQSVRRNAGNSAFEAFTPSTLTIGGSNTYVQYNNSGALGGDAAFIWDSVGSKLTLANGFFIASFFGSGIWIDMPTVSASGIGSGGAGNNLWIGYASSNGQWLSTDAKAGDVVYRNITGALLFATNNTTNANMGVIGSRVALGSGIELGWSSSANTQTAIDTGFARNAAGVVEINNGSAGTFRDLKARNIDASTAYKLGGAALNFSHLAGNWTLAQGPSTTASVLLGRGSSGAGIPQEIALGTNLSMSGTTLNATGGGGTPASPTTSVQWNNSGALGGDAGFTWDNTNKDIKLSNAGIVKLFLEQTGGSNANWVQYNHTGTVLWYVGNDATQTGGHNFTFVDAYDNNTKLYMDGSFNYLAVNVSEPIGWGSTVGTVGTALTLDTALLRNAAGVVEINNGTAGQYRDLYARNITLQSSGAITGNGSVPTGGTTGQVLAKNSNTNYDIGWAAAGGGGGTAPETLTLSDAGTASTPAPLILAHNSSGTPTTNFGTSLAFKGKDSTTNDQPMGGISTIWTNATHGVFTQASALVVTVYDAAGGTLTDKAIFSSTGGLHVGNTAQQPASGIISAVNGFKINNSTPAAGLLLQSDGTQYTQTSSKWPLSAGTAGRVVMSNGTDYVQSTPAFPTAAGTAGYTVRSDGTNFTSYPQDMFNSSTADDTSFSTSDRYVAGSAVVVAAGDFKQKGQYRCVFDMVKSAGTGAIVITARVGTAGTTSDTTATIPFTFGAGTSVADTGTFEVIINWRSVGSGTSAVISGLCRGTHNLATTGLFNNAASWVIVGTTSSGFNSTAATTIGVSFNGSTAFAGTNKVVQAVLIQ